MVELVYKRNAIRQNIVMDRWWKINGRKGRRGPGNDGRDMRACRRRERKWKANET